MRWPSRCLAAVILVFFLTSADGQRGSRRFNPSNVNDVPEEEATTARSHRFQNRDRSKSEDVPRQDFPRRDAEVLPTRSAPSRVQLRSRNEVSSRDSRPGKEVPIVSSGAVEYERLQQPETTRRTHTPRAQTLSGSSQPEESKFSRSRGDGSSRAGSTEARRPASRFPKRDSIGSTDGNTVQPITDEPTTRRSFSRPRASPSSSSQSEPPSRLPSRGSFRKATEAPMENFSPRSQADALRTTKNIPEVRSRTGGDLLQRTHAWTLASFSFA